MFTYYDSNTGKTVKANKEGWWVACDTESCDQYAVHIDSKLVPNGINNQEEAQAALEKVADWEFEGGVCYAYAKHYGYQEPLKQ